MPSNPALVLESLWRDALLPAAALQQIVLTGRDPVLRSSFAVGTAAQASIASAALAAAELGQLRNGVRQQVGVDMRHAALECTEPQAWDKLAGLYACGAGAVRLHTNFAHHRDGVLRLLVSDVIEYSDSAWGRLEGVRPAARFSHTPAGYARPSMRPGSHPLAWPAD